MKNKFQSIAHTFNILRASWAWFAFQKWSIIWYWWITTGTGQN